MRCHDTVMPFFNDEDFVELETPSVERPKLPAWIQPPSEELPVRLPDARVLYRRDSLAVVLKGIEAYQEGVQIDLLVLASRSSTIDDAEWDAIIDEFHAVHRGRRRISAGLRLGMRRSDGLRAVAGLRGLWSFQSDAEPPSISLVASHQGGGGDDQVFRQELGAWLWPLPTPGELELFYAWPELAIPEGSTTLDANAIIGAAARAQPIWADVR